jgi:hypothetical protein
MKDLRKMNIILLCKWWWMLENEEGLWQDIVNIQYVKGPHVCLIHNMISDFPCLEGFVEN